MPKKYLYFALLIILMLTLNGTAQSPARPTLVLISVDGLKPDYLLEADKYGLKIANLRQLIKTGSYASGVIGVVPTYTYPSHTTIVTGVSPNKHGILANTPFDPYGKNQGGWYWYAEDIKVPTLWDAAGKAGLVTASVDWPVTVGAKINYNIVQYWRAATGDDLKLIRALSTSGLMAEAEQTLGPYPDGYDYSIEADQKRTRFNIFLLEHKHPNLLTSYFGSLDEEEHAYGPYSPEAFAVLEKLDLEIGKLRAAAEQTTGGRAIICVVSDHGFTTTENELEINSALRAAGLIKLDENGKLASWQAIGWNSGGVSAIMLANPDDQMLRNRTEKVLAEIAAKPENGIISLMNSTQLQKLGAYAPASFLLCAKPGFRFGGKLQGDLLVTGKRYGTHGFLPTLPEMESVFLLSLPGEQQSRNLGRIDMRDIAPTLAGLLGIELPQAEGVNLLGRSARQTNSGHQEKR